jgi:hypothetical protein
MIKFCDYGITNNLVEVVLFIDPSGMNIPAPDRAFESPYITIN